jgi:DNA-binding HxlR family transcriptional regulator
MASSEQMNPVKQEEDCTVEKALNIIGGKWSFLVIRQLFHGTKRFGEIKSSIRSISSKALTDTLRHLEHNGILTREAYATIPPTVEYKLTERGQALHKMIHEMKVWAKEWT